MTEPAGAMNDPYLNRLLMDRQIVPVPMDCARLWKKHRDLALVRRWLTDDGPVKETAMRLLAWASDWDEITDIAREVQRLTNE